MFLFNWLLKLREKFRSDREGDVVKPFLDHMEDLRWMLIKVVAVLVTAMVAAFWHRKEMMALLTYPMWIADPTGEMAHSLRSDNIMDPFLISLKLAFYVGIILALPFILYFVADFVLPALTRREKRVLLPGFGVGVIFFLAGAMASYFYIVPHTLSFFFGDAKNLALNPLWTWKSYISVFTWLVLGFGLMCEIPLLVILMSLIGVVNYDLLSKTRNYAITIILVLAAIVAPTPDPITLFALSLPIIAMYEGCIWIVWGIDRSRRKKELGE